VRFLNSGQPGDLCENVGSDYVLSLAMQRFSAALGFPNSAAEIRFFKLGDLAKAYGPMLRTGRFCAPVTA
jgi:hypothetical protein